MVVLPSYKLPEPKVPQGNSSLNLPYWPISDLVVFQEVVSTNQHSVSNYLIASLAAWWTIPLGSVGI
jgi:hypothetical protein